MRGATFICYIRGYPRERVFVVNINWPLLLNQTFMMSRMYLGDINKCFGSRDYLPVMLAL